MLAGYCCILTYQDMTIVYSRVSAGLLVLTLAACASGPVNESGQDTAENPEIRIETADRSDIDALLNRADRASPARAADFYMEAARLLFEEGNQASALEILDLIDLQELDAGARAPILLLQAQLLSSNEQHREVLELLNPQTFPTLARLEPDLQNRYHQLRAGALNATGASLNSALELIQADRLLTGADLYANHEAIWDALVMLPQSQLQAMAATAINFEVRGWYELALIGKSNPTDPDRQLVELLKWRNGWARHPAASILPAELQVIEDTARDRPSRIALLLPLGTASGQVVRDAFMSAYYSMQEIGGQVPLVKLYDTTNISDIVSLHRQARQEGAQLVIGPLLKPQVNQLRNVSDLGVPTLALNTLDGLAPASPLLYQFALAPEDEARQLANKAWQDGHRYAAILAPVDDAGNDYYARKRDSFTAEWQLLGGRIVANMTYRDDYTTTISSMLELDVSEERRNRLRQLTGKNLQYQPRRRQDVDFILLLGQTAPARQIVPSLAYLYAGDLPVYASQDVYSGLPRPAEDRDLNGVIFGESPWVLDVESPRAITTRMLFPLNTAQNLRLQAFGLDAFTLYPRLRLLSASSEYSIPGATGRLHLGPNRNIQRDLVWTSISEGLARPVPE
jgi:outer membrane PBP1 activator LpoA protein